MRRWWHEPPSLTGQISPDLLTELAARTELSLSATSELVNELEELGYLQRVPDPRDGRAKLIAPTERGHQALDAAAVRVAEIEDHWGSLVGHDRLNEARYLLDGLLTELMNERT